MSTIQPETKKNCQTKPSKSKAAKARKRRAMASIPGTVAADRNIEITDKPSKTCVKFGASKSPSGHEMIDPHDVFSSEELVEMPIVYVTDNVRPVSVWRDQQGRWFREGGYVLIQIRDGRRVFKIGVRKGANSSDLLLLEIAVQRMKAKRSTHPEWRRSIAPGGDEQTLQLVFNARAYMDPYLNKDPEPTVAVCGEVRCKENIHESDETYHTMEILTREVGKHARYQISIEKGFRPGDTWHLDVYSTEFAEASPEMVATFTNDLNWLAIECANANAKEA